MAGIQTNSGKLWAAAGPERPGMPTIVLIHGAGGSRLDWQAALRRIDFARMVSYDLAGHGRSSAPVGATMAEHAADLAALLDGLNIPAAVLAGHSMGGAIALQAALDAPGRVQGLILMNTGARLRVSPAILNAAQNPPELARLLRGLFWGEGVPEALKDVAEARIAAADPALLVADFTACNAFDVRHRLGEIAAPALILCGAADVMTPPALSHELRAGLTDAGMVIVPGAGHRLPDEHPLLAVQHIQRWLGGLQNS